MNYAIIAAGEGSRLTSEGVKDPKPLIKVGGERLIDRLIRIFLENKANKVVVICNDLTSLVVNHLQSIKDKGNVPLQYFVKTTPSSMHSLEEMSPLLEDEPFILTTVDTIFSEDKFAHYTHVFNTTLEEGYDCLMAVTTYIEDESPLYIDVDENMNIMGYYDCDNKKQFKYISAGIYALSPKTLKILHQCIAKGESRMRNFQRALVNAGLKLKAYNIGKVLDVDHKKDIETAEKFLEQK